jgi:hypothetical protein
VNVGVVKRCLYGHPIVLGVPSLFCKECGQMFLTESEIQRGTPTRVRGMVR